MALTIKHTKVSILPDGTNADLVRPSDWNANHALTGTTDIVQGGTGATTAAQARTNLGVQQMSTNVPTLTAGLNPPQSIPNSVQTAVVFNVFTTNITGLTWNATKKGFVNTTANTMNLIVAFQAYWAIAVGTGLRGEYIRVYNSSDVLIAQYGQELDYSAPSGAQDFNSASSPVIIPAGGYMNITVVQTSDPNLNCGGLTSVGLVGTTLTAMQLFAPI